MTSPKTPDSPSLSPSRLLSFALLSLPTAAVSIAISVYVPRHYARHMGIDLALVGAAFFTVRAIDIPIEVILGWAIDRTRSRLGRCRLWSGAGMLVLMAGAYLLLMPSPDVGRYYLIGSLLLTYLGVSIMTLSTLAWAANLAPADDARSKLFGILAAVGVFGAATAIGIPILNGARGLPDAVNVPTMGLFVLTIAPLTAALALFRTPEGSTRHHTGEGFGPREIWRMLARPSMARIMLTDLCLSLGPGWMSALYLFYFTDSRGFTAGQASILLAVYILSGIVAAPLIGRFAARISKHGALTAAAAGYSLALLSFMAIPPGSMAVGLPCLCVTGFLGAGLAVVVRAMVADIADEARLELGRDGTGLIYSMVTMTEKFSGAVSIGLTYWVLSKVGYHATDGAENTPEAIRKLEWAYLAGPIVFVMLGALCMVGYKLTPKRHADILEQLNARAVANDIGLSDMAKLAGDQPAQCQCVAASLSDTAL